MIRRPSDCWPKFLLDEYRRLAALPGLPVEIEIDEDEQGTAFSCRPVLPSFIYKCCSTGVDFAGLVPGVRWLAEGPKIADVTEAQYQALSRVEVRLEVKDFAMPFPTVLVNMPADKMHEYTLVHTRSADTPNGSVPIIIAASCSDDHRHDIITVVRQRQGRTIEESLSNYTKDVEQDEGDAAHAAMRVACNLLLAMTNYGSHAAYLYPKEVEQERKYIAKGNRAGRDGRTASMRLAEQPVVITLDREVKLWHTRGVAGEPGPRTGREMPFHWRRGHWRKVKERKLLVRPCMVRADLLMASPSETTTTYR